MDVPRNSGTPPNGAVVDQLRKMLEAPLFSGAAVRTRLLTFLVDSAIAGKPLNEDIIGYEVFPEKYKSDESDIVRVNCSTLRKHLASYYKAEGIGDTVVISLPKGKAYRAHFQYGISSEAAKKCTMVRNHLRSEYPVGNGFRLLTLWQVLEEEPIYAPAHAGLAECNLWAAVDNSQGWLAFTFLEKRLSLR